MRSRVAVQNLVNPTSQNNGGPVSVQPIHPLARPPQIPQPPQPELHPYEYKEHDRTYFAIDRALVYPFPCDEESDETLDYLHILIHDACLSGDLHQVDLSPRQHRLQVLDVGHGTGIWVYELAQNRRHADVVGIDLHSRTPKRLEEVPNASFIGKVDFLHPNWPVPLDYHDLIRMSMLCGSVPNWWSMYQIVSRYLRPGTGYIEHIEFDWTPRVMDKHALPSHANELLQWWSDLQTASRMFGKPIDCPTNMESIMEYSGLTDVTRKTIRVPLRYSKHDERETAIGGNFQLCISHQRKEPDRKEDLTPLFFDSMCTCLFTRQLQIHPQAVADLCARLRAIVNGNPPIYFNLHVWTARRPGS